MRKLKNTTFYLNNACKICKGIVTGQDTTNLVDIRITKITVIVIIIVTKCGLAGDSNV